MFRFFNLMFFLIFSVVFFFFTVKNHKQQSWLDEFQYIVSGHNLINTHAIQVSDGNMSLNLVFFLLLSVLLVSSFCVVYFKKLMNSLIHLIIVFITVGLLLLLLNLDFLAVLTLLIYIGAIMVFFLFAILLLLKFFSFKTLSQSKSFLISMLDLLLLIFSFFGFSFFCYAYNIDYFDFYTSENFFIHDNAIAIFIENSINRINYDQEFDKEFKFLFCLNNIFDALFTPPSNVAPNHSFYLLSMNIFYLDLVHVYGLQLYTVYSIFLIVAGLLLSVVIYAALSISRPYRFDSRFLYV